MPDSPLHDSEIAGNRRKNEPGGVRGLGKAASAHSYGNLEENDFLIVLTLYALIMMRTLLRRGFSTASDYLSTKDLRMFGSGDYPQALDYSRPFRTSF